MKYKNLKNELQNSKINEVNDMEENKEIQRPFLVEVDGFKKELFKCISDAYNVRQIPFYVIELVMSQAYTEVQTSARNELAMLKAQMNKKEGDK